MCFSASASFAAAGMLGVAGIATLRKAKTKQELPLAAVPLVFAVQQLIEGIVWIYVANNLQPATCAVNGYLFFANVLWPIFIPIVVLLLETDPVRKRMQQVLAGVGVLTGIYMLYTLLTTTVAVHQIGQRLVYAPEHPYAFWMPYAYVAATCLVCLISSKGVVQLLGVLVSLALFVSYMFYLAALPSVWCFLAAVLSLVVVLHFWNPWARAPVHKSVKKS